MAETYQLNGISTKWRSLRLDFLAESLSSFVRSEFFEILRACVFHELVNYVRRFGTGDDLRRPGKFSWATTKISGRVKNIPGIEPAENLAVFVSFCNRWIFCWCQQKDRFHEKIRRQNRSYLTKIMRPLIVFQVSMANNLAKRKTVSC